MKTSSFVTLFCSLAINGLNTFNQPALAEQLPRSWYTADGSIVDSSLDVAATLIATQVDENSIVEDFVFTFVGGLINRSADVKIESLIVTRCDRIYN